MSKAWLIDLVPGDARGRALGNQQGLAGGGAIVAGVSAGVLWNTSGTVPLVAAGVIAAGLALVLLGAGRRLEHEAPVAP